MDPLEVSIPVSPVVEPEADQQQDLQIDFLETGPSLDPMASHPASDPASDPAPGRGGSISPEIVGGWRQNLQSMQRPPSSVSTSDGSSDIEYTNITHEQILVGGGGLQASRLQVVSQLAWPLTIDFPLDELSAAERQLNEESMGRLQTIKRCRDHDLDRNFNLRDCCLRVLDCEPLAKAMSEGLNYGEEDTNVYVGQLLCICTDLLKDSRLFHKVVKRAVEKNLDHIMETRSGIDCHFITVENREADNSFPPEILNLCRYVNNLCMTDEKPENEATKFVLQAILYQLLSHDWIKTVLCRPFENHSEDLFSLDLGFLWDDNQSLEGILLSPRARVGESSGVLKSPRIIAGNQSGESSAFKNYTPVRNLEFPNDPKSSED